MRPSEPPSGLCVQATRGRRDRRTSRSPRRRDGRGHPCASDRALSPWLASVASEAGSGGGGCRGSGPGGRPVGGRAVVLRRLAGGALAGLVRRILIAVEGGCRGGPRRGGGRRRRARSGRGGGAGGGRGGTTGAEE